MAGDPRKGLQEARRKELLETAQELADVLRERIREAVGQGLTIDAKPDHSVVTNADLEGEQAFRAAAQLFCQRFRRRDRNTKQRGSKFLEGVSARHHLDKEP